MRVVFIIIELQRLIKNDSHNELGEFSRVDDVCDFDASISLEHVGDRLSQLSNFVILSSEPDVNRPITVTFYDRLGEFIESFPVNSSNGYAFIAPDEPEKIVFERQALSLSPSRVEVEYYQKLGD